MLAKLSPTLQFFRPSPSQSGISKNRTIFTAMPEITEKELPANLKAYIQFLESCLATPISAVSTGPARGQFLRRRSP